MPLFRNSLFHIHLAVFLFGFSGLFVRWVPHPAVTVTLWRLIFATVTLFLVLQIQKRSFRLHSKQDAFAIVLMGVVLAAHWITFFTAIEWSNVAIGLLTFSTFPVFVTLLEPLWLKTRYRASDLLLALITLMGVACIVPRFELGNHITQGALSGVLSGFLGAVLAILNRQYVQHYASLVLNFYEDSIAALLLLPSLLVFHPVMTPQDIGMLVLLGVVFTALAHTLYIQGMTTIKAQTASIITTLEPVYAIVLAMLFLGEIPTWRTLLGGSVILAAAIYATWKSHTDTPPVTQDDAPMMVER